MRLMRVTRRMGERPDVDLGVSDAGFFKKGSWTPAEEDALLLAFVEEHGAAAWNMARSYYPALRRTGKSCRLRYLNQLRPGIRRLSVSPKEERFIFTCMAIHKAQLHFAHVPVEEEATATLARAGEEVRVTRRMGERDVDLGVSDAGFFKKGSWTPEEDALLLAFVEEHGAAAWNMAHSYYPALRRTGKSCRLRYLNQLRHGIRRQSVSPQEGSQLGVSSKL